MKKAYYLGIKRKLKSIENIIEKEVSSSLVYLYLMDSLNSIDYEMEKSEVEEVKKEVKVIRNVMKENFLKEDLMRDLNLLEIYLKKFESFKNF